jgi:hypothetical protein
VSGSAHLDGVETVECPTCGRACLVTTLPLPAEIRTIVCRDGAYVVGVHRRRIPAQLIDDEALIDATVAATRAALAARRRGSLAPRTCGAADAERWASFLAAA